MMLRKRKPELAPKLLASRTYAPSMARTPARRLITSGKKAPMNTINSLDSIPTPTQMRMSGRTATFGTA